MPTTPTPQSPAPSASLLSVPATAAIDPRLTPFIRAGALTGGMSCREVALLASVQAAPGRSVKHHSRVLDISPSRTCDTYSRLEARGLIERRQNRQNLREVRVTLTDEGAGLLRYIAGGAI